MALNNYVLNGPSQVILDDARDPYVSWQHHLDRTSGQRGGVDLVAVIGTPVLAPTAGWVRRRPNNGSAGNSMWFEHRDNAGWGDVFSHLSSYTGSDGQFFEQGQVIAYSGNTGGVIQHLHRHLEKGGVRYNPWDYFSGEDTVDYAYGLTPECQGRWQAAMQPKYLNLYDGPVDNDFGKNSVKGMQQHLINEGYLPGTYEVDGIPGPNYGEALQRYAAAEGIPLYTGPIDKEPGRYTSESLVGRANQIMAGVPPVEPPAPVEPTIPTLPAGWEFVIDVGSSQAGMDFTKFKLAGGVGVIIKAGGGNASDSPYVAPHYLDQLARARAAGLKIGHYWFNGLKNGLNPATSAEFFINNIDLLPGEIVALDIEAETATQTAPFSPEETRQFVAEVKRLRPGLEVFLYMSAALVRSGDWRPLVALGCPLWVAMYNDNDGSIPTDPPNIDDWAEWTIWQYTSARPVPGNNAPTDCNVSKVDAWAKFGYAPKPVDPEPEPEPEPTDDTRVLLAEYLSKTATLAEEYAGALAP